MNAESIARALGGRKAGGCWTARCPAHDDRTPSLSIQDAADGKLLAHCHAGCEQQQVIAALRDRGLWMPNVQHHGKIIRPQPGHSTHNHRDREHAERTAAALRIWRSAVSAPDTLVA